MDHPDRVRNLAEYRERRDRSTPGSTSTREQLQSRAAQLMVGDEFQIICSCTKFNSFLVSLLKSRPLHPPVCTQQCTKDFEVIFQNVCITQYDHFFEKQIAHDTKETGLHQRAPKSKMVEPQCSELDEWVYYR